MSKLTRNLYIPYIDLDRGANKDTNKYRLGRVRKSTTFNFQANAQEETFQYIDTETDTTEVTSYQPGVGLETVPESTDPIARFAQDFLFEFPLGVDTQVPYIQVYPLIDDEGVVSTTHVHVIIWDEAVMSNLALDSVGQKFTWDEKLNGSRKSGIMPISAFESEEFTFEPVTPPTETVQTFSAPKSTKKADEE